MTEPPNISNELPLEPPPEIIIPPEGWTPYPPEAGTLPDVDPRSGSTWLGIPYPAASDPVSQGAAAMQALATEVDKKMWCQQCHQFGPVSSGVGEQALPFDQIWVSDFGPMSPGGGRITFPHPGRVLVVGNLYFSGATGSGDVRGRIVYYTPAGVASFNPAQQLSPFNGNCSMAGFCQVTGADSIVLWHQSSATGTGHSVTGNLCAMYLG